VIANAYFSAENAASSSADLTDSIAVRRTRREKKKRGNASALEKIRLMLMFKD